MNNANTVKQPYELLNRRDESKLTPGFLSRPSVFYLCNGQDLTPRSGNAGVPDLVSESQEIVIYPQKVHRNHEQLRGCVQINFRSLHAGSRSPWSRTWRGHQIEDFVVKWEKKRTTALRYEPPPLTPFHSSRSANLHKR